MTNLLLLLSAMLSALIGAGPVTRVAQAPVAVASATRVPAAPISVRSIDRRPPLALPSIAMAIGLGAIVLSVVPAIVPAWKTRRRE